MNDARMRQRDAEMKEKGRRYGDQKAAAKPSKIELGDTVLAKNYAKTGKLVPTFNPKMLTVTQLDGPNDTVTDDDGVEYSRHVSHLMKTKRVETVNQPVRPETVEGHDNEIMIMPQDQMSGDEHEVDEDTQEKEQADEPEEAEPTFTPKTTSTPWKTNTSRRDLIKEQLSMQRRHAEHENAQGQFEPVEGAARPTRQKRPPPYLKATPSAVWWRKGRV